MKTIMHVCKYKKTGKLCRNPMDNCVKCYDIAMGYLPPQRYPFSEIVELIGGKKLKLKYKDAK